MLPRTLISFSLTVIFCILIFALLPLSPATPVLNAHALEDPVHRVASTKKATPQAIQDATALQEAVIDSGIHSRVPSPGISPALWYPPLSYANPAVVPAINAYISITLLPRLLPTTPVTHLLRDATSVIDELLEWQGASSELPNGEFSWVEYGLSFRVWQEGHANGAVTLGVLNAAVTALIAGMQKEGSWKAAAFVIYNGLQEVGRGTLG